MAGTLWGRDLVLMIAHVYKRVQSIPSATGRKINNLVCMPLLVLVYVCIPKTPFHGGDTGSIPVRDASKFL